MNEQTYKLVALVTNHVDDVYCFRKELIEKLILNGYQILISCPYGEKFGLMQDIKFEYIDTHIDRRGTNILKDLKLFFHYFLKFRKYKPSIILNFTIKPNVYSSIAAQLLKIPYINNVTGLGSIINEKGFLKLFIIAMLKIAFKKSSCVFFQNKENMDLAFNKRLIKGKFKLIPGSGVNIERFQLLPYPTNQEKIIFNYIGRILKEKGIDDYLEAAKRIKREYPNTEFNVIGFVEPTESHYFKTLKKYQEDNIIIYYGNQKDIRPFILRSHCIIHPSKYGEGISNVLLESASCGRPAITTNIAGCREVVDDEQTGFLYKVGDLEQLISKIRLFLKCDNKQCEYMGLSGRKKIIQNFNRNFVVDAYLEEVYYNAK